MDQHIRYAYRLEGGAALADEGDIAAALRHETPAWLHLQADHPDTPDWIETHLAYLDLAIREALVAPETRPRVTRIEDGLLLILRGVNTNPGADPEDMVSLRVWIDPARIVTLSRRPLASLDALARQLADGTGPDAAGAFLAELVSQITDRIEPVSTALDDRTDALEEVVIDGPDPALREEITDLRLQATSLRRYIAPQRDALRDLGRRRVSWLAKTDRRDIAESLDRTTRAVEEIESTRERLQLIDGELANAVAERLNRNLYVLSVISAVFLPLGFLTGLMGINLGGMPGADASWGFWIFTGGLAAVAAVVLVLLRRARLIHAPGAGSAAVRRRRG